MQLREPVLMKRSRGRSTLGAMHYDSLVPLSREHLHALVIARRLRDADTDDAQEARQAFLLFWQAGGRAHFRAEEEVLFPTFAAHADPYAPLILRALGDHVALRRDALALEAGETEPAELRRVGTALAAHVRMEERQLFPLIRSTLGERERAELGARLAVR
jgi:hypothetical protein